MAHRILIALCILASAATSQGQIVFENDLARLSVGEDGRWAGLSDKPGNTDWLTQQRPTFAYVRRQGAYYPSTHIVRQGDELLIEYGNSGVTTRQRITARPHYFVIQLVDVQGPPVEEVCLVQAPARISQNVGSWLDVRWNEQQAVCFMGLSMRVNTGGGRAIVYPQFGTKGEQAALVVAPTQQLLDVVQEVEKDCGLPSPRLGGVWAKRSADVKRGYLFMDVTEANVDEVIRYAKLGEFQYVMVYDSSWSASLGSYPINLRNYPRGEESLKATVDKLHAAGLKAGLHMLTSFVGKNDPLVRPVPDKRLLKDAQTTLASDLSEGAVEIPVAQMPDGFPREAEFYGETRQGFDVQIDDEIIRYGRIGGAAGKSFIQCQRGAYGTRKAAHKAGAAIEHLCQRYGCCLVDLRTGLKDELAERVAGIVNRCGFDMIYFDGGEVNSANGPYWYWVSVQQTAIWQRFQRDVLVQGSGGTPWTWHFFARGACDDFAAVAPKQYLDYHKIQDSWQHYTKSFMPAELGWWGFLADTPCQPATSPDEVEFYAVRMLALDSPVSLETHLSALKANGRTEELLRLLGEYERLRLSHTVPADVREKLRSGEWHMIQSDGKPAFVPIRYSVQRVDAPSPLKVDNAMGEQPLKFRLQCVPALAAMGDKANFALLQCDQPAKLALPAPKAAMPGNLAASVDFTQPAGEQLVGLDAGTAHAPAASRPGPLNLLTHRALAVKLRVALPAPQGQPCAVLNVQLQSSAKTYRDYYIDLDFTGEKTIVIPEPTTQRMLPEFRPAPANYAFKSAMYGFDFGRIERLNLRWMRLPQGGGVDCSISQVEALAESEKPLETPSIGVGGTTATIPATLKTGDYAEWWGEGSIRIFDRNGVLLQTLPGASQPPQLPAGEARLEVKAAAPASAKCTLITTGKG